MGLPGQMCTYKFGSVIGQDCLYCGYPVSNPTEIPDVMDILRWEEIAEEHSKDDEQMDSTVCEWVQTRSFRYFV